MIPILFGKQEIDFTTNGLGRLTECISCIVTEERNGIYECEFDYPITGRFYQHMHDVGGIVGVIHDDHADIQAFDIYSYSAPINGVVTFYAHHISYRLNHVMLKPFEASTVAAAMSMIPAQSANTNQFTFWTDKTTVADFKLAVIQSVRAILGGQEGSLLDVYGGEYEFDNFSVKLYANRGSDTGVTIRYGKNMTDITQEYDESGIYNAIAPYWRSTEGDQLVILPEVYVTISGATGSLGAIWEDGSGNIMTDNNGTPIEFSYITSVPFAMDFSSEFQEKPTVAQLRQAAIDYMNRNQPWIPQENITVDFVQLWQTPEYENVAILQRVGLCDEVSVFYPELGVTAEKQKVIKTTYNVLAECFDSMELGKSKTSLMQQVQKEIQDNSVQLVTGFEDTMQAAINDATKLITGGLGGFVVFNLNAEGQPQEILIMDTNDINTAVNVIRMNRHGIGFSTTGYNGLFRSAWTIDGSFNADFINSGTINGNIIRAGIISDYYGYNWWNLDTGELSLQGYPTDYDLTESLNEYDTYLSQQVVFNKLTNNGQTQGIYLSNGLLYLNASYINTGSLSADYITSGTMQADRIKGGTLTLGGSGNTNGSLIIQDANGNQIGIIDNTGANLTGDITLESGDISSNIGTNYAYATDSYLEVPPSESGFAGYFYGSVAAFTQKLNASNALKTMVTQTANDDSVVTKNSYYRRGVIYNTNRVGQATAPSSGYLVEEIFTASSSNPVYRRALRKLGDGVFKIWMDVSNATFRVFKSSVVYDISDDDPSHLHDPNRVSGENYRIVLDTNGITLRGGNRSIQVIGTTGYVNGNAIEVQSSSSKRYKHDIDDICADELEPERLLKLPVRQFVYNEDFDHLQHEDMKGKVLPGFIAEEVEEIYPSAVIHNDYGDIESWDERRIVPGMLALIQKQDKKIKELEERLEKLERLVMGNAD